MEVFMQYAGGFVIGAVAAASPGPDTVLVLRSSTAGGVRAGVRASLGIAVGLLIHAAVTLTLVLGVRQAAAGAVFPLLQVAGAAYLGWLGVRLLLSAFRARKQRPSRRRKLPAPTRFFLQGFLTNVMNPKAILFFTAVVSQFIAAQDLFGGVAALAGVVSAVPLWFIALSLFAADDPRTDGRPPPLDRRRRRRPVPGPGGAGRRRGRRVGRRIPPVIPAPVDGVRFLFG